MRDRYWGSRNNWRRSICAVLLGLFVMVLSGIPVLAAGAVQDDGNLFSANARTNVENKIAQIQRDTGKTVAVKTVSNLGGKDISAAADQYALQQKLNGVLIFAARDERKLQLKIGVDTRPAVPTAEEAAIRDQLTKSFAANDFDGGLLTAIDRFGSDLRAAAPARTGSSQPATPATATTKSSSGFPVLLIVLLVVVLIAVVLIVMLRRNRTPSGPSGSGGGSGSSYPQQGGYGPGYGPGYGQPSGGGGNVAGSIIGGAAAGIGGAIIGNAIYDHFRDENQDNRDRAGAGDYGNNDPQLGNDQGRMDDSPVDGGSWDSGGSDPGAGDWGSSDSGGGDSGGGGDPGSD